MFAQNSLTNAQNNLAQSVQRLSSGLRINSAKDDSAGLAIAQNMQSQINGTNQSIQNLSDATNLLQTADSSLSTIQDMLLRMKQLATQGYDGSLNVSQKQDIVQQLTDLNTEINQTAARTQFNGISLLTSGATVDSANSDIKAGTALVDTAVTAATTASTLGAKIGTALADTAISYINGGTATNAVASSLSSVTFDPNLQNYAPGTYTLTSSGDQLTMTGTFQGQTQTQTITVGAAQGLPLDSGASKLYTNAYSFSNFGITLNTSQTISAGMVETGAQLASALSGAGSGTTLTIAGQTGEISSVSLTGTAPGTYQLSQGSTGGMQTNGAAPSLTAAGATIGTYTLSQYSSTGALNWTTSGNGKGGTITAIMTGATAGTVTITGGSGYAASDTITLASDTLGTGSTGSFTLAADNILSNSVKMTGTVNGILTNQTISLADASANTTQNLNFSSFGIQMNVTSNQIQSGNNISTLMVATNGGAPSTAGQVVVSQGTNSNLQFQSGATSAAFIGINTSNVQTNAQGSNASMQAVGTNITGSGKSNLATLGAGDSIATWQAAFQTLAANIDSAVDTISTQRSTYGSQMNRLSYISQNLTAQSTNLSTSKSAITDTNFASETATLTKGQIMQQAATAMLAQANQMPNVILSLLK
jgi:flagellin